MTSRAERVLLDHELNALMLKFSRNGVTVDLLSRSGRVAITKFLVAKNLRGRGLARSTVTHLCTWADKYSHTLGLTPSAMYGSDIERLTTFFGQYGFVANPEERQPLRAHDALVRYPKGGQS